MTPTVLLFDLDGTLLLTGGAGRRAMERAFVEECGDGRFLSEFSFGGMTDQLIVRTGLRAAGESTDQERVDAILQTYLGFLPGEVEAAPAYRVLPGVVDLLERLTGRASLALGLGTGNIEPGARVKLGRGDLSRFFSFGGFGCDHEDRVELLREGVRRGAAVLGAASGRYRVVVIGDTPRDVEAAEGLGASCLAVATGGHEASALRDLGAELAVEDLTDPAVFEFLTG